MRKLKVGFVGLGRIGSIRLNICQQLEDIEVIGFFDRDALHAEGLTRFPSLEGLLNQKELDAVFISVPNSFTVPYAIKALQRGVSVFAEKPPGRTVEELRLLQGLEGTGSGPALMFGFNHRHKSGAKYLLNYVNDGSLGEVLWIRGRYGKELESDFFDGWRARFEISGGGILLDQGIHMVDLMRVIGGDFDEVHSLISNKMTGLEGIEDNVFAIYRSTTSGISASLHSTMTQWRYLFSLEVFLEHGSLVLNGLRTPSGNYGSESLTIHTRFPSGERETRDMFFDSMHEDSWDQEVIMFSEAIANRVRPPIGNLDEAIATMQLVEATYSSDRDFARSRACLNL